jgi:hypothetical protein
MDIVFLEAFRNESWGAVYSVCDKLSGCQASQPLSSINGNDPPFAALCFPSDELRPIDALQLLSELQGGLK